MPWAPPTRQSIRSITQVVVSDVVMADAEGGEQTAGSAQGSNFVSAMELLSRAERDCIVRRTLQVIKGAFMTPQTVYHRQVEANERALRIKKVAKRIETNSLADKVAEAVEAEAVGDEKSVRVVAREEAEVVFGISKRQSSHKPTQKGKKQKAANQQQHQQSAKKQSGGAGGAASSNKQPNRPPSNPGRGGKGRGAARSARDST